MGARGTEVEDQLARFATANILDDDARRIMRLSIFDWTVCVLAGQAEPVAEILLRKGRFEGGIAQSTVIGGDKLPASRAALINGAISHALDYDDTHFDHIGHTSVAVVPAALAVAQAHGKTMVDFVDAALIGSEAAVRVGTWLGRDHYQVGFHQTATSGAFGAALASLRLMEATRPKIVNGLGLAATRASGLKSQFGTMGKPLNAGIAAEAGVEAASWAMVGMTSADFGLSGPLGFAETHHGVPDGAAFIGLGADWRMKHVRYKFHACCHGLHAMLEALGSLDLDAATVAAIHIKTHPRWMSVCNKAAPRSGLEAKFSYRQTAAMKLMGVETGAVQAFSDDVALHPALEVPRERVHVLEDGRLSEMQAQVSVDLLDGRRLEAFHDLAAPMEFDMLEAKLKAKGRALIGEDDVTRLWEAVHGNSLRTYVDLLGTAAPVGWTDTLDLALEAFDYLSDL